MKHRSQCLPACDKRNRRVIYGRGAGNVAYMSLLLHILRTTRTRVSYHSKLCFFFCGILLLWITFFPPLLFRFATCAIGLQSPRIRGKIFLVGHRGTEVGEPENTLASAKVAAKAVGFVEIDLTTTQDGDVVLMHDVDLERTTNGSGKPCEKNSAYLRSLVTKDGQGRLTDIRVPRLNDVFAELPKLTRYMLDIKECSDGKTKLESCVACDVLVDTTARSIASYDIPLSQIIFTSTDTSSLYHFQKRFSRPSGGAISAMSMDLYAASRSAESILREVEKNSWDGVAMYLYFAALRPDVVRKVQDTISQRTKTPLLVFGWTVRTSFQLRTVLCAGVRHIITADPLRFRREVIYMLGPNSIYEP